MYTRASEVIMFVKAWSNDIWKRLKHFADLRRISEILISRKSWYWTEAICEIIGEI